MIKSNERYSTIVVCNSDGAIIPSDRYAVLMFTDNAVLPTLDFYHKECARIGVGKERLDEIDRIIAGVERLRAVWSEEARSRVLERQKVSRNNPPSPEK